MAETIKKIQGNYSVYTVGLDGVTTSGNISLTTQNVNIYGNLTVSGTTTTIDTENSVIADKIVTLNRGETGAGVSGDGYSGIEIDRGTELNAVLRFNENLDVWEVSADGVNFDPIATSGSGGALTELLQDTSPQLGGNLDINGFSIVSTTNQDIVINPNGTGVLEVGAPIKIEEQASDPSPITGFTILFVKNDTTGGSSIYYTNDQGSDELVSKRKAKKYGLIF